MFLNLQNTDTLELLTDSTAALDVKVTYTDITKSTRLWLTSDTQLTKISTATTTTICSSPAATETRAVANIEITNTSAGTVSNVTLKFDRSGTEYLSPVFNLQPGAGVEWVEGVGWYPLAAPSTGFGDVLERRLDATQTGQNIATVQPWFPILGAVAVEAGTVYDLEGLLNMTRAAGTTSHTTAIGFGGTATLTSILWRCQCNTGDTLANAAENHTAARAATSTVVKAASTSATEEVSLRVAGTVKFNAAGTFIPQFTYSATPGGAPTIQIGSFFALTKRGVGFSAKGTWT
jgi:hypothetical protein